tara:strand:+ start:692 stop:2527 length:1836 start_codon:yes stop_codon:yes gene_type:complete
MAADKTITINFVPKGDAKLIAAFQGLAKAQKKFNGATKDGEKGLKSYGKGQGGLLRNNRLLDNSFATLRSKMLLFNFAMAMGIKQLGSFIKESAKVESMGRAFFTLSGGAESSTIAMSRLKEATNGTMSQFDLFQQANNAMVLGITKNSSEMAEMFDIAQRLGRALGKDTASSVESLITGIGRQSRLMLDNIGIIVKADEAYRDYANKIGTTADKLSDADKKTAFLQATMSSARAKVALLGDEVNTSQDSFDRLATAVKDASIALGSTFKSALSGVIDAFLLEEEEAKNNSEAIDDTVKSHDLLFKSSNFLENGLKNLQKSLSGNTEAVQDNVNANINLADSMTFVDLIGKARDEENRARTLRTLARLDAEEQARIRNDMGLRASQENAIAKDIEFSDGLTQRSRMVAQAQRQTSEEFKTGLLTEEEAMERFKNKTKVIDATILQSKANSVSGMIGALGKLNQAAGGSSKASARMAQVSATIDALAGANKAFAQGGIFGFSTGAAILASGMANVVQIEKNIGKFEQGGLVGGRRHSQGGTMIEAEQGEFVMSRTAVQAVGVEAMNRINQGGGAGNIVLNISGNVMSDDFVEDTIAPKLKEAIRRGADIGVS